MVLNKNIIIKRSFKFAQMFLTLPNGLKMPTLGLGTSGAFSESELENAVSTALEAGYRHIDSAFIYGNEKVIGRAVKKSLDSGKVKRNDLFITTKLPVFGLHPDRVEFFMKKSLENLQLDYVDLYLVHFPFGTAYEEGSLVPKKDQNGDIIYEGKTDHAAIWKKMEDQVAAGRAKSIGLSNYTIPQMETVLASAKIRPANLQIEVHVFLQQRDLVTFCRKNGITVTAFSPLGSPGYNARMQKYYKGLFKDKPLPNMLQNATINKIAEKHSKNAAQVMLRFLVQMGIGAIPKSVTPQRIRDNFNIFDFELDSGDMAALEALEVGEEARITDFVFFEGAEKHPDYPFPRPNKL